MAETSFHTSQCDMSNMTVTPFHAPLHCHEQQWILGNDRPLDEATDWSNITYLTVFYEITEIFKVMSDKHWVWNLHMAR